MLKYLVYLVKPSTKIEYEKRGEQASKSKTRTKIKYPFIYVCVCMFKETKERRRAEPLVDLEYLVLNF